MRTIYSCKASGEANTLSALLSSLKNVLKKGFEKIFKKVKNPKKRELYHNRGQVGRKLPTSLSVINAANSIIGINQKTMNQRRRSYVDDSRHNSRYCRYGYYRHHQGRNLRPQNQTKSLHIGGMEYAFFITFCRNHFNHGKMAGRSRDHDSGWNVLLGSSTCRRKTQK